MGYSTTWYHLDKNNKVLSNHVGQACFSYIRQKYNFEKNCQYLIYDFSNMKVTQEEARQYFLFLKSIPEFKELMPKSCKDMANSAQYKVDLHKFNGTKIFTILTLIRAVVEDPKIVQEVIKFDRKFKYSLDNFGILKMCGSVHMENSNHWITERINKPNLSKMFKTRIHWDDPKPCIETGLGSNIHATFNHAGDRYAVVEPVQQRHITAVREEKDKPAKPARKTMYTTNTLQLQGV